ncbi:MAG: hypothetical protein PVJ64_00220 [Gemmatimonadales bacterium]|jgi:hypothetical protein
MALTQAHLDKLDEMIASGILESRTADGKRVQFESFDELRARRDWVARALAGSCSTRDRVGYAQFED